MLVNYAAQAERYLFDDPNTALIKLRQFAELLAQQACANVGISTTLADDFSRVLGLLRDQGVADYDTLDLFQGIPKAGNLAAHDGIGTRSDALHHLRMARQLAIWFDRSFGKSKTASGPFVPPPDPAEVTASLAAELARLRDEALKQKAELEKHRLTAAEEAEARRKAAQDAERARPSRHSLAVRPQKGKNLEWIGDLKSVCWRRCSETARPARSVSRSYAKTTTTSTRCSRQTIRKVA